jgi:nicotinate-nucleotide adenylyltransferase
MTVDDGEDWRGARIGILGGTFDPPHAGHVRMAAAARDALGLDRVFFSPAPHPPHKQGEPLTGWEHRRGMTAAAIAGEPGLFLTGIERGEGPSYTVDLLRAASARTRADLYFILGADSLAGLASWREPREILRLCTLAVFPRDAEAVRLPVPGSASVVVFESPRVDVSSTGLRAALAAGAPSPAGMPPAVLAYIERHRLYGRS